MCTDTRKIHTKKKLQSSLKCNFLERNVFFILKYFCNLLEKVLGRSATKPDKSARSGSGLEAAVSDCRNIEVICTRSCL